MMEWKPCPFCGVSGEAEIHDDSCFFTKLIEMRSGNFDFDVDAIKEAWNTRAERTCVFSETREIETEYDAWIEKRCSCGEWIPMTTIGSPNYCPSCGAKVIS